MLFIAFVARLSHAQTNTSNLFVNSTENIVRLDFTNGTPQVSYTGFGSGASIGEGIAHVEDADGRVIIMVNSSGIYDRDGMLMPASAGILAHPSSTEIVICKRPASQHEYYVIYNNQLCSSVYYTVVDLSKRNGKGDVTVLNRIVDDQFQYAEGLEIVTVPCSDELVLLAYRCYTGIVKFRITSAGFSSPELIHALNTNNHGGRGELDYHKGKLGYAITFANKAFLADLKDDK